MLHKINTLEVANSTNYSDNKGARGARGTGIYVRTHVAVHADVAAAELIVRVHYTRARTRTQSAGYKLSCSINRAANMHEEGVARVVVAPSRVDFGNVISRPRVHRARCVAFAKQSTHQPAARFDLSQRD